MQIEKAHVEEKIQVEQKKIKFDKCKNCSFENTFSQLLALLCILDE